MSGDDRKIKSQKVRSQDSSRSKVKNCELKTQVERMTARSHCLPGVRCLTDSDGIVVRQNSERREGAMMSDEQQTEQICEGRKSK